MITGIWNRKSDRVSAGEIRRFFFGNMYRRIYVKRNSLQKTLILTCDRPQRQGDNMV